MCRFYVMVKSMKVGEVRMKRQLGGKKDLDIEPICSRFELNSDAKTSSHSKYDLMGRNLL